MTFEEFHDLRASFEQLLAATPEQREIDLAALARQDPPRAAALQKMLAAQERDSWLDAAAQGLPAEPLGAGASIGPYQLERELGRGGMGVVFLARRADGNFDKRVAIKILRGDPGDAQFLDRFRQERKILAQLDHPHIAAILDAGTTPAGDPYFVMEYVDGVPINTYCRTHSLTLPQKLSLFLQVCGAVQHAHRNLTVHRDLKPGNILVTNAGAAKLLDFGIAKLLSAEAPTGAPLTAAILTPEYASPEQIRREAITTSTDVFALGILLYELVSGAHPFKGSGQLPHEVMRAICEDDPAPLKGVPAEIGTIIRTALRKQPAWRYASVEQLADDIDRYLRGLPVLAQGDSVAYRLRKFVKRQWLVLSAAALVLFLLVGGIVATAHQARLAEQARVSAERARAEAEAQRTRAEEARQVANTQRGVAEQRTKEAEMERQKEQERYRELRSLASSLLFDLHDGVRDLAGSATARRLIVSKAQQQLELLSAGAQTDIDLQRDLAASYERMGELRMDPRDPGKTGNSAALADYHRAVELRKKIAGSKSAQRRDRRDLALSLAKLGEGEFFAGNAKLSVEAYQSAWNMAKAVAREDPKDASLARALGSIDERRCAVLMGAGDSAGALDACQEGIATLSPLGSRAPDDLQIQRLIATTEASYANALRLTRKPQEAGVQAKQALETLEHLEALAPSNAEYRRLSSSAEMILAGSLAASGQSAASLDAFRRSVRAMEVAIEIDPSDLGSPLRLAATLMAFSRRLTATGDNTGAHDAAKEALQLLDRTTQKPGAGPVEWNEYADALLKADWPDLSGPQKALDLAQHAVRASDRKNPFFLDTLAWALYRTGDAGKAVTTEREALGLLPANAKGGLHDELDKGLNTFLAGAGKEF